MMAKELCGNLKIWPLKSLTLLTLTGGELCPIPLNLGPMIAWSIEYGGNYTMPVSGPEKLAASTSIS